MDTQDYSQELMSIAKEYKNYAFEYKKERAMHSEALNKLINLMYQAGLSDDKASFENKLPKLIGYPKFRDEAQGLIKQFYDTQANYKGWEPVLSAYQAHISAIQSVIKYNLTGELNTNLAAKAEIERYL